jgi:DNA (cytosine-5)-methyltransferase 1
MFLDKWLKKAYLLENFRGSKAKFEWQAGQTEEPNIWETIMHFRPSGLRVKKPTYFPALVAITHTSIIGEKKRYLTPREGARLQSFPDSFILSKKDTVAYKQLGNSVNVEVVKLFAKFLLFNNEFNHKDYNLNQNIKKLAPLNV